MKKVTVLTISALITWLYTIFVAQCFWNWFAAFSISFWQMFGIYLLINFFTEKNDRIEEKRWEGVYKLLETFLPESEKQTIEDYLEKRKETEWTDAYLKIGVKLLVNTLILIFGFVVHGMFL